MKLLNITNKLLNEFLPQWNGFKNINEVVLNCIEINQINPINHLWYYSGGGNYHYFILDDDEHIWSFNVTDQIIEYSYNRWNSINDYLEIDIESKSMMVFMVLDMNLNIQSITKDLKIKNGFGIHFICTKIILVLTACCWNTCGL